MPTKPSNAAEATANDATVSDRRRRFLGEVVSWSLTIGSLVVAAIIVVPIHTGGSIVARYNVTLDFERGVANIEAELKNLRQPVLPLISIGKPAEMNLTHFEVLDADGDPMWVLASGQRRWIVPLLADTIRMRYGVQLGVDGRHGLQGAIESDFAVLPTKLLLVLPWSGDMIASLGVKIHKPDDHQVVTAWPQDDEGWYRPELEGAQLFRIVKKSAFVVGPFEKHVVKVGGQSMEVHTHARFPQAVKERIRSRAQAIYQHLHELLDFDMKHGRYVNVFVPTASDGQQIFGASWTMGHVYELWPDTERRWQLLAHRITHVFNRDKPYGLVFDLKTDAWFYEGLASWMELSVTRAVGIAADDSAMRQIFTKYWVTRQKTPSFRLGASADATIHDEDVINYLHYTKDPVVTLMLDHELHRLTKGERGMEQFFAWLYKRYGNHAKPIPSLQAELEEFSGGDFELIFKRYVHADWPLLPLWDDALASAAERLAVHGARSNVSLLDPSVGEAITALGLTDIPADLSAVALGLERTQQQAVTAHRRRLLAEAFGVDAKDAVADARLLQHLADKRPGG